MNKNLLFFTLGGIILGVLLTVVYYDFVAPRAIGVEDGDIVFEGSVIVPKEEAAELTLNYIKENIIGPDVEVAFKEINEESGVYEIKLEIMGQEEIIHITKNAKYLFVQHFDMRLPKAQGAHGTE